MIRWHWARRFGVAVAGFVVLMGLLHFQDPRSFGVKGPEGRQAVLLSVRGRHGQRQVHPGADADDGRLLPEVPQGRLRRLVPLGAPPQLVQQQGVPDQRPRDAQVALERDGSTQAARWCAGCHDPVPFFSGEFDDPDYDDVNNPHQPGGHHLHLLPRDHQRQQHPGQRRLHDRGARALSVRLQRQPGPAVDQQHAGEGQARDAQEDVPQAGHQGPQVLLDLPQGRLPVRREPLQGLRPRAEPLRPVPALGRLGPRGPELLLSARSPSRTASSATWS